MNEYVHPLKNLDEVNARHLERYARHLELKNLRPRSIKTKVVRVHLFLQSINFKDAVLTTRDEVEDYLLAKRKACSEATVWGYMLDLRLFIRFITPEKESELFQVKMRRPRPTLPTDQVLTREDIQRLVNGCNTQRDRALVMIFWDSGCRLSEIASLNLHSIKFNKQYAEMVVDGKTGKRHITLTESVPDLVTWVNMHPLRNHPESPLFITYTRYGTGAKRLSTRTIENRLKNLAKQVGITKRVHPHGIRHARCTDLTREGFTEMELREIAGWERNSMMPEVYVHLSGRDVQKKILRHAGILEEESDEQRPLLPRKCPRCQTLNPSGSLICSVCSLILDPRQAATYEGKFTKMLSHPGFLQWLAEQ
jgi:site-specific recombinase XerD